MNLAHILRWAEFQDEPPVERVAGSPIFLVIPPPLWPRVLWRLVGAVLCVVALAAIGTF